MELPVFAKKGKEYLLYQYRYNLSPSRFLFDCHSQLLGKLVGLNQGKCFIVGTGQSLNDTNLDLLKGQTVFGVNTLYRNKELMQQCEYYACSDGNVWEKHGQQILDAIDRNRKATLLFLSSDAGRMYAKENSVKYPFIYYVRTNSYINLLGYMSTNPAKFVSGGHSVIADICLPMVWWMGYDEVYLVGCDYDNLGTRWDGLETENPKAMGLKERERIFDALKVCKKAFENDGRKIYNSTVGGALEVFERKSLEEAVI